MPIFMDRHKTPPGVTLTQALQMHDLDLAAQKQFHCNCLTFWMDPQRRFVSCLIEAPNKEAVVEMHRKAHGDLPEVITDVHPDLVMAFLGRIGDLPEDTAKGPPQAESSYRCIMFTDLMDSTAITARLGDQGVRELFHHHDDIIRKALATHRGREVKHTGDGFMGSFSLVSDAVACAQSIQLAFAEFNETEPSIKMHVRIGLAAGEPVEENRDLFGSAVQLAARICATAEPGQILAHDTIRGQCGNRETNFAPASFKSLKGFEQPVLVGEICWK
jgi:class 3 adenylate cyclase